MALSFEDLANAFNPSSTSSSHNNPFRSLPSQPGLVRGRKTLPFPLPDPYENADSFYDPHGMFTSRRSSGAVSNETNNSGVSGGLMPAGGNYGASAGPPGQGIEIENQIPARPLDIGGSSSLQGSVAGGKEVAPAVQSAASAWLSAFNSTPLMEQSDPVEARVDLETDSFASSPVGLSSPAALSHSELIPTFQSRAPLNRLRIGSSGTPPPLRSDSPSSSSSWARPSSTLNDDHEMSDSRSRGSSLSQQAWSPAASFLSSFSVDRRTSAIPQATTPVLRGDEEGFEVAGVVLGRLLGAGGFGIVREGRSIADGEKVAVKIVNRGEDPATAAAMEGLRRSMSGGARAGSRRAATLAASERTRSFSSPGQPPFRVQASGSASPSSFQLRDLSASLSSLPGVPMAPDAFDDDALLRQSLLEREITLWKQLAPHPHIMPLLSVHQTVEYLYIFMPLCTGGNLLDLLNSAARRSSRSRSRGRRRPSKPIAAISPIHGPDSSVIRTGLPLASCLPIFSQVVSGLAYLHNEAGVTHKDIKLENILCDEPNGSWRITDFGLTERATTPSPAQLRARSKQRYFDGNDDVMKHGQSASDAGPVRPGTPLASLSRANSLTRPDGSTQAITEHLHPAGSLPYSPPEQMRSPIPILDRSVDMWALGCVLYALVSGHLPFEDEFEPRLRMKIMAGTWSVPAALTTVPNELVVPAERALVLEVLTGCLEPDPRLRWTIDQVRNSEWLTGDRSRGRSRARPTNSRRASSMSRGSSESATRRKERSTSRGPSQHAYGVDPRTKEKERGDKEREERKMRWDRTEREGRGPSRGRGSRSDERLGMVAEPY